MAWSSAELSADELAWMAADKPLVLGQNLLRDAQSLHWRAATGAPTTYDDASYPLARLHDAYTDLVTRPNTSHIYWTVIADFGPGGVTFDSIAIINQTYYAGGASFVTVEIADDNLWTLNPATLTMDTVMGSGRLVYLDLRHTGSVPRRYSGVRYLAIGSYDAGGFLPEVGEIVVSRRRQLKTNPFGAWDPNHLRTRSVLATSLNGVKTRHVRSRGERVLRAMYHPHEDARVADLRSIWEEDTDYGSHPFVWVDKPTSEPERAAMMVWDQDERTATYLGPYQREIPIQASEQGPHYVELDP